MKIRHIALIIGLAVGVVWVTLGFERLVLVLVCGAVGYIVGRVLEGELDVQRFIDELRRK
jgi:uncharacterized membrane protein